MDLKVKLYDANNMADELGQIRAEIRELQKVAKGMESLIKAQAESTGSNVLEGDLFRVAIGTQDRATINWQKIAKALSPSRQLITGNTTSKTVTSIKVTAHKKEA
ncbi:MAG: hypothetical protein GY746_00295 [Gammaproteobacteria bacterium]|nr:hypothetical protein [Gammaproteobacteria bacterium]